MKTLLLFVFFLSFVSSNTAWAMETLFVTHTCRKNGQKEATFSADENGFSGPVGGSWEMTLGEEEKVTGKSVTAKTTQVIVGGRTQVDVEITMVIGRSGSKDVGTRYILKNIYGDAILEKYNLSGGFAGDVKLGTFECTGGNF